MSYRRKHIKSKIHKVKPRKSILRRPWFWIVFLLLIVVLSAFYFFLFYSGVQVKNIVISGNQKIISKDIENLISDNINNKILGLIDSRSIFLINSDKLNKEILNKFPIIESVKIDKKFMQTLEVKILERKPVGIFCGNNEECFMIDQNGVIFEKVIQDQLNNGYLIVRQTLENEDLFTGEKVVQQNIMDLLLKVEKNLKDNFQINIKTAVIASPIRLNIETNENWQIYFDLSPDADINSQITKLNLLLTSGISSGSRKNLRYVDLRPKDRAVVCDNQTCGE